MVWAAAAHLPTATFKVLRAVKSLARQIGRQAVADKLAAIQQGTNTRTDVFDMLREFSTMLDLDSVGLTTRSGPRAVRSEEEYADGRGVSCSNRNLDDWRAGHSD
jgi:hypothetical protein